MHRPLRWGLGLLLGWAGLAWGQGIPVYDNTNFLQNLVTAAQSTLTAIATAETAANTILDLTPLDEIITASGMIEDLTALAEIMAQVDVLSTDIASLQAQVAALFGLDTAPASTSELQVRLREIRRLRSEAYVYAMRLQTLMRTAIRTIEHLGVLVNSISSFIGNKQGTQTLVQMTATISKTLTIQTVQTAAYERAGSLDKMEELLTNETSPQQAAGYQNPKPETLKTAPSGHPDDAVSCTSFRCLAS